MSSLPFPSKPEDPNKRQTSASSSDKPAASGRHTGGWLLAAASALLVGVGILLASLRNPGNKTPIGTLGAETAVETEAFTPATETEIYFESEAFVTETETGTGFESEAFAAETETETPVESETFSAEAETETYSVEAGAGPVRESSSEEEIPETTDFPSEAESALESEAPFSESIPESDTEEDGTKESSVKAEGTIPYRQVNVRIVTDAMEESSEADAATDMVVEYSGEDPDHKPEENPGNIAGIDRSFEAETGNHSGQTGDKGRTKPENAIQTVLSSLRTFSEQLLERIPLPQSLLPAIVWMILALTGLVCIFLRKKRFRCFFFAAVSAALLWLFYFNMNIRDPLYLYFYGGTAAFFLFIGLIRIFRSSKPSHDVT